MNFLLAFSIPFLLASVPTPTEMRGPFPAPTGSAAADSDAPFCALRFGCRYTDPDKWPAMRAALGKNRAAFDEVWFSTGITFPTLAWHEEHARQCAVAAADLRKLGIVPSMRRPSRCARWPVARSQARPARDFRPNQVRRFQN